MQQKEILFSGKTIRYREGGQGPVLVLVHGFLESSAIWEAFSGILSEEYRLIIPDLPGHGGSESLGPVHFMSTMAEILKTILDSEQINEVVLVGHSMGGYVSLAFARKWPGMVRGLCLFHSHAAADTEEGKVSRQRTIEAVRNSHTWFIRQFIPDLFAERNRERCGGVISKLKLEAGRMDPMAIIAALEGMKNREDNVEMLASAAFPVFYVAGAEDKRIPYEMLMAQASQFPECSLHLLRDAGHMGWAEMPEECLKELRGFAYKCLIISN